LQRTTRLVPPINLDGANYEPYRGPLTQQGNREVGSVDLANGDRLSVHEFNVVYESKKGMNLRIDRADYDGDSYLTIQDIGGPEANPVKLKDATLFVKDGELRVLRFENFKPYEASLESVLKDVLKKWPQ
jgi:hypothetical protein